MKKLFEFMVPKETEVEETEVSKNEKGEEIKTTKKVKKKEQVKVFLRKPTRALFDEAELFYGVRLSEGIKAGLLTRALLSKRFTNDGGVLSEEEKNVYATLYVALFERQNEFQKLSIKDESERTEQEKIRYKEVVGELTELRTQIQDFETAQASLFDQTAENRARKITNLYKHCLFILEDAVNSQYNMDNESYQKYRKRILDHGNDTIREIEEELEKFDFHLK